RPRRPAATSRRPTTPQSSPPPLRVVAAIHWGCAPVVRPRLGPIALTSPADRPSASPPALSRPPFPRGVDTPGRGRLTPWTGVAGADLGERSGRSARVGRQRDGTCIATPECLTYPHML